MTKEQIDLFDTPATSDRNAHVLADVEGLRYIQEFLSDDEQDRTLREIDKAVWRNDLQRRVQHYGWRYDYRSRIVSPDMRIGEFPVWLQSLGAKLCEAKLFDQIPDQAIVNEYLPGQGIAMHIDRQCFGPVVATISLGDAWHMDLRPLRGPRGKTKQILLEAGSVLILSGDARYEWMHGISSRQRERKEHGGWRRRERRLSVTFRTVLSDQ